jgi:hypothetical protein
MSIAAVGSQPGAGQASYLPELFLEGSGGSGPEVSVQHSAEPYRNAQDGFDTGEPTPMGHAADGIDTNQLTSAIGLIGALAGTASAATAGGLISGLAAGVVAVIKGVEALAEDHKKNGKPNPDPMRMDRPIDKK